MKTKTEESLWKTSRVCVRLKVRNNPGSVKWYMHAICTGVAVGLISTSLVQKMHKNTAMLFDACYR